MGTINCLLMQNLIESTILVNSCWPSPIIDDGNLFNILDGDGEAFMVWNLQQLKLKKSRTCMELNADLLEF